MSRIKHYTAWVDGHEITTVSINISDNSQHERNVARRMIAKEFKIPQHYIRLRPKNCVIKYKWDDELKRNIVLLDEPDEIV